MTEAAVDGLQTAAWGLKELVLAGGVGLWLLAFAGVARAHLRLGHPVDAAFTAAVTALPVLAAYAWHLGLTVDMLPEPPTVDPVPSLG